MKNRKKDKQRRKKKDEKREKGERTSGSKHPPKVQSPPLSIQIKPDGKNTWRGRVGQGKLE